MGTDQIEIELINLGYQPVRLPQEFISFTYTVPHGRFRKQKIEIALQAPQFPDIPPSGPYVKPFLLKINGAGEPHPYGAIHDRKQPTGEYQYWSRPFPGWDQTEKTMAVYLAFFRTLLDFE